MKRLFTVILSTLAFVATANALTYSEARSRAWYLTDKMAYELNLTEEQYDRAYEINLDYFLSIDTPRDAEGIYWQYRNNDLCSILFDWQYDLFASTEYFFRPLIMVRGAWWLTSYNYYDRNFYYFNRPIIYNVYRGRSWRHITRYNPYRDYRLRSDRGMRDRYIEARRRPGERYDMPTRRDRIERSPGRAYQYEWHNPGQRSNADKANGNRNNFRSNSNNLRDNGNNFNNSRNELRNSGTNRNLSVSENRSSGQGEVHFGRNSDYRRNGTIASSGNNYRDKDNTTTTRNASSRDVTTQSTNGTTTNRRTSSERKYNRADVFGGGVQTRSNANMRATKKTQIGNSSTPTHNNSHQNDKQTRNMRSYRK